jgi:hypothetical protein
MTKKEFETLKLGDLVTPIKGINKNKQAKVIMISDITCERH